VGEQIPALLDDNLLWMTTTRPVPTGHPPAAVGYEAMAPEQATLLTEFARACKSAARAVSLYPGAHPAITSSLSRLVAASERLVSGPNLALMVDPHVLVVEGRAPSKPDQSVVELAALLHERLIGTLRIDHDADTEDWRTFLLLAARTPEELIASGGIGRAWTSTGRRHFEITEIDYAEVLKEREGRQGAAWDRVLAFCLRGESVDLDEAAVRSLLDAVKDPARFGSLVDRLRAQAEDGNASASAQVAALFQLLRTALDALAAREGGGGADSTVNGTADTVFDTVARASPRLSPEMLLRILEQQQSANVQDAAIARGIVSRIDEGVTATFVAQAVTSDRGATERLALAFAALVPDTTQREHVLERARAEAEAGELGTQANFGDLWASAAQMLVSYSDAGFVSTDYARELSGTRTQAIEVERLSDDPPERIQGWLTSVDEQALSQLDLDLSLDLLRLSHRTDDWEALAAVVVSEIERRTQVGDFGAARTLAAGLTIEAGPNGRPELADVGRKASEDLSSGPLMRHVVTHFRKAHDKREIDEIGALCQTVGPGIVRRLAEALTIEEHTPTIRRLRELLLSFGAAGREAVEPLKNSSNPAVRRTAIDLLRVFGGNEALKELTSMLSDADPEVQRESVRAIVQIGTPEAYAVMKRALDTGTAPRDLVISQLIGLRDDRAVPLLCHVLATTVPRGPLVATHEAIIEAVAGLGSHAESIGVLKTALHRGEWWAPVRTATLRRAAAAALQRIGSPEALAVLQDAARLGRGGVRKIAREASSRQPAAGSRDAASTR
jgi:hypothetical protein